MTTPTWDEVASMGAEDYTLGRPYRSHNSPDPMAYARGWDEAAAAQAREALAADITQS